MRICPRCGRPTSVVIDGLCPQCYAETHGIASLPGRIDVEVCRYCGRARLGHRWVEAGSFEAAIRRAIEYHLSRAARQSRFQRVRIAGLRYETLPNWNTRVEVELEAYYGDYRVTSTTTVTVRLHPSICPVCKTRVSGEYDTVLQVRGASARGLSEEELAEQAWRLGLGHQLVDVIQVRDGVNVYFTNPGAARKLAKKLIQKYGGTLSRVHYEHVTTTSTGQTRTRRTILLRLDK